VCQFEFEREGVGKEEEKGNVRLYVLLSSQSPSKTITTTPLSPPSYRYCFSPPPSPSPPFPPSLPPYLPVSTSNCMA
jgi:hypothetical protein